jgi:hypothetical protein
VGVADQGSHAAGVEDAIKITSCGLGRIGEIFTGSLDQRAGFVGLLQPFRPSYASSSSMA